MPLQQARARFLETLGACSRIRRTLFGKPLRLWKALSPDAANKFCLDQTVPWFSIYYSPQWLSFDAGNNPEVIAEKEANCELVPLREALLRLASTYGLMYGGEPAVWAMQTIVETLRFRAGYPESRIDRWIHNEPFSQEYPAKTEEGWIKAATGEPEDELFTVKFEIAPKPPNESFKTFEKRSNEAYRRARESYIETLKAEKWRIPDRERDFTWIDRLAQWQAGKSTSEIDSSVRTGSQRAAFSRGLTRAGNYIAITPRISKYNPKRRPEH